MSRKNETVIEDGVEYIKVVPPTWEASVRIFMTVLENPDAREQGRQIARDELLRLAAVVDKWNEEASA